ncbi:DUF2637 domain-containing protein [Streptomyces laurentii]|uniref:DUF2637 domain-containing protein n=1 Tax=Streptomyces laurentii TaxID=39478 RepID=UPI0033D7471E
MTAPTPAHRTADRYTLLAASAVILALTTAGFWLSYAHLAEIAGQHGLGNSPARQWAWPATLDAFIVAGELLTLRASLRREPDGWAVALTAGGSLGSIALNVAGVTGTRDPADVPLLDYVVAAVPPAAALLAFGVLMRQIHQHLARPDRGDEPERRRDAAGPSPANDGHPLDSDTPRSHPVPAETGPEPASAHEPPRVDGPPAQEGPRPSPTRKVGRPATGDLTAFLPIVERIEGPATRSTIRNVLREAGHTISNERLTELKALLTDQAASAPSASPMAADR